jgi:hypothetical protein
VPTRRLSSWRRCIECRRKATHYATIRAGDVPLCGSHAAAREARGEAVRPYPPGPLVVRRLWRLFQHAATEAERLGFRDLAEGVRRLVKTSLSDPKTARQ